MVELRQISDFSWFTESSAANSDALSIIRDIRLGLQNFLKVQTDLLINYSTLLAPQYLSLSTPSSLYNDNKIFPNSVSFS